MRLPRSSAWPIVVLTTGNAFARSLYWTSESLQALSSCSPEERAACATGAMSAESSSLDSRLSNRNFLRCGGRGARDAERGARLDDGASNGGIGHLSSEDLDAMEAG